MRLHSVYARFYRSLNYDFIRASGENYSADPWDATTDGDYPFVRIKLRPGITTVVGANESGKSQVLCAIEAALTGEGYERSDFCRYSRFFSVDEELVEPEFGAVFTDVTSKDVQVIESLSAHENLHDVERVAFFRMNQTPVFRVYVRQAGTWSEGLHVKTPTALATLGVLVPFRVDADVPLPDSVPIEFLVSGKPVAGVGRAVLRSIWDGLVTNVKWFDNDTSVQTNAPAISALFRPARETTPDELQTYRLAEDLLVKVAGIQRPLFQELQTAVKTKNGYANSIVDTINSELAKALDFPHWWSQDSQFELFVSLYEFDLVFMIRDRTGRSYGFDERSDGLKYFLSYFVQYLVYLARGRDVDKPPVIVLIDNDADGDRAKADLAAGGAYGDKLIDPTLVLQLGQEHLADLTADNPLGIAGIEDAVPFNIALAAAASYCREFVPTVDPTVLGLTPQTIYPAISEAGEGSAAAPKTPIKNKGTLKYLELAIAEKTGNESFHLDKIAFARATVDVLTGKHGGPVPNPADLDTAHANFEILLSQIALKQRQAERAESVDKISSRVNRAKRDFTRTHHGQARREDVIALIEEISSQLDNSPEAEDVRIEMRKWHHAFDLDTDPRGLINDYQGLVKAVDGLAYRAVRAAAS